jgi:hypothetical protein
MLKAAKYMMKKRGMFVNVHTLRASWSVSKPAGTSLRIGYWQEAIRSLLHALPSLQCLDVVILSPEVRAFH